MSAVLEQEMPAVDERAALNDGERPFIIFPNLTGDVTITWDDSNETYVKQMVEEKMKAGYVFFILKPRKLFGKTIVNTKTKVKKVSDLDLAVVDAKGERSVSTPSDDIVIKNMPADDSRQIGVQQSGLAIAFDAKDKDLNLAIENDKIQLVKPNAREERVSSHRAKTADEVVKKQSVGTRPIVGG